MKITTVLTLMLSLGVTGAYAHEKTVTMTFSGTEGSSPIDLRQPDPQSGVINTSEFDFSGEGTLGSFTFRSIEADSDPLLPKQSVVCAANLAYYPVIAAGGVFRFSDGSLLKVKLTEGHDCIDFQALQAFCTRNFEISGGTGRFNHASGKLTLTETATPLMSNAAGAFVFFTATGEFKGSVSGLARDNDEHSDK